MQKAQKWGEPIEQVAANALIVLIRVTCKLLDKQIVAQAKAFQNEGGFTERLFRVRKETRRDQ